LVERNGRIFQMMQNERRKIVPLQKVDQPTLVREQCAEAKRRQIIDAVKGKTKKHRDVDDTPASVGVHHFHPNIRGRLQGRARAFFIVLQFLMP
jgi:hypothetical protein